MGKFTDFLGKAGGLISGLTGIGQSIIAGQQSRENTDRTIRANRQMAEYQYSKDLEMWNRSNEYNSPEMQMERLKAAGLNPNLVYGSGGAAGNTTPASMPKYNAPTAQYNYLPIVDVSSAISAYQDMQVRQAQYDNLNAQRNLTEQKYLSEGFMTRMKARRNTAEHELEFSPTNLYLDALRADYELKRTKSTLASDVAPYQLSFTKGKVHQQSTQVQKMIEDMKKTQAATEFTKLQNEWYVTKMIGQFGLGLANTITKVAPWRGLMQGSKSPGSKGLSLPSPTRSFLKSTDDLRRGRFGY